LENVALANLGSKNPFSNAMVFCYKDCVLGIHFIVAAFLQAAFSGEKNFFSILSRKKKGLGCLSIFIFKTKFLKTSYGTEKRIQNM